MGRQSGVGDNAKTPLLTAELLRWPCITQVTAVKKESAGNYLVSAMADEGIVTRIIKPPCVLAVGNAPSSTLRVPTLRAIKEQSAIAVKTYAAAELISTSPPLPANQGTELLTLEVVNRRRGGLIIEGADATEKAQILYQSYLKGWLAEL